MENQSNSSSDHLSDIWESSEKLPKAHCDEWKIQNSDESERNHKNMQDIIADTSSSENYTFNICSPNIPIVIKETFDHSHLVKEFDDLLFELSFNKKCSSKLPVNEFDFLSTCDSSYAENCKYVLEDENNHALNLKSGVCWKQKENIHNLSHSAHETGILPHLDEKILIKHYESPSVSNKMLSDEVKCISDLSQICSNKLLDTCDMYHNDTCNSLPVAVHDNTLPVELDNLPWINSVLWDYQKAGSSSNQKDKITFALGKEDKICTHVQESVNHDKKTKSNMLESGLMKPCLNKFIGEFSDVIPVMTNCSVDGSSKFKEKHVPPYMYKELPKDLSRISELVYPDSLKSSYQKKTTEHGMPKSMKCFLVNLYIEAKDTHSGPFLFEIYPKMTLRLLKLKVEQEYSIAVSAQMWILGRTLAVDNDMSLYHYGVLPGSPLFLYVDSAYKMPFSKITRMPVSKPKDSMREDSTSATIVDKVVHKTKSKAVNKSMRIPLEMKKLNKDGSISQKKLESLQVDQVNHNKSKYNKFENFSNASESAHGNFMHHNWYSAELEPITNSGAFKNISQEKDDSVSQLLLETYQNKDYEPLSEVDQITDNKFLEINLCYELQSETKPTKCNEMQNAKINKNVDISDSEKVFPFQSTENNDLKSNIVSPDSFVISLYQDYFEPSNAVQQYSKNQVITENSSENFEDAEHQDVPNFWEQKLGSEQLDCESTSVNSAQPDIKVKNDKNSILKRLNLKHRRKSKENRINEVSNNNNEVLKSSSLDDTTAESIQPENDCSMKLIEIVNAPCQDERVYEDIKELCDNPPEESIKDYESLLEIENVDLVKNNIPFICPVCFDEFETSQGVILHDCLHFFCQDCLARTIEYSENTLIKCPYRDDVYSCQSYLQQREIKALVSADLYEKYLRRSITTAESLAEKSFHCKTPDCPGWCMFEDNINVFHCPVCHHYNCLNCRAIHEGFNCRQYQNRLKCQEKFDHDSEKTLEFLNKMIDDGKAMKCPKCDLILMKKWGCDWLKCSICHTEICWITKGPRWGPAGQGDTSAGCRCGVNGIKCHPSCTYCH